MNFTPGFLIGYLSKNPPVPKPTTPLTDAEFKALVKYVEQKNKRVIRKSIFKNKIKSRRRGESRG